MRRRPAPRPPWRAANRRPPRWSIPSAVRDGRCRAHGGSCRRIGDDPISPRGRGGMVQSRPGARTMPRCLDRRVQAERRLRCAWAGRVERHHETRLPLPSSEHVRAARNPRPADVATRCRDFSGGRPAPRRKPTRGRGAIEWMGGTVGPGRLHRQKQGCDLLGGRNVTAARSERHRIFCAAWIAVTARKTSIVTASSPSIVVPRHRGGGHAGVGGHRFVKGRAAAAP